MDLGGSFEITLERLPIFCTEEAVGIFALAETPLGEFAAQARAVYFVAIQPPATGTAGTPELTAYGRTAEARTALQLPALLAVLASTGAARNRLRAKD